VTVSILCDESGSAARYRSRSTNRLAATSGLSESQAAVTVSRVATSATAGRIAMQEAVLRGRPAALMTTKMTIVTMTVVMMMITLIMITVMVTERERCMRGREKGDEIVCNNIHK
jgi:hypothetical protein